MLTVCGGVWLGDGWDLFGCFGYLLVVRCVGCDCGGMVIDDDFFIILKIFRSLCIVIVIMCGKGGVLYSCLFLNFEFDFIGIFWFFI